MTAHLPRTIMKDTDRAVHAGGKPWPARSDPRSGHRRHREVARGVVRPPRSPRHCTAHHTPDLSTGVAPARAGHLSRTPSSPPRSPRRLGHATATRRERSGHGMGWGSIGPNTRAGPSDVTTQSRGRHGARTSSLNFAATERPSHSCSVNSRALAKSFSKTVSMCLATPSSKISTLIS